MRLMARSQGLAKPNSGLGVNISRTCGKRSNDLGEQTKNDEMYSEDHFSIEQDELERKPNKSLSLILSHACREAVGRTKGRRKRPFEELIPQDRGDVFTESLAALRAEQENRNSRHH